MRRRVIYSTPMFPELVSDQRRKRVEDHRRTMRVCWPAWDEDLSVGALINCGSCISNLAEPVTLWGKEHGAGSPIYTASVPAKIVEVVDDETFIAAIHYFDDVLARDPWTRYYQGIKLRLDILDVWVPVELVT